MANGQIRGSSSWPDETFIRFLRNQAAARRRNDERAGRLTVDRSGGVPTDCLSASLCSRRRLASSCRTSATARVPAARALSPLDANFTQMGAALLVLKGLAELGVFEGTIDDRFFAHHLQRLHKIDLILAASHNQAF